MLRDLIIELSPIVLACIFFLFCIVKLYLISTTINANYISLFFSSITFYNKVTIRNTFHEKLKSYYRQSNTVNMFFYSIIAIILAIFLLMKSI